MLKAILKVTITNTSPTKTTRPCFKTCTLANTHAQQMPRFSTLQEENHHSLESFLHSRWICSQEQQQHRSTLLAQAIVCTHNIMLQLHNRHAPFAISGVRRECCLHFAHTAAAIVPSMPHATDKLANFECHSG